APRLRRLFAEMEAEGRRRLGRGFTGAVEVRRSADMRYGEQTFEIPVPLDGVDMRGAGLLEEVVRRFHRRHEELYTYSAPEQDVTRVTRRRGVVGRRPGLPGEQPRAAAASAVMPGARRIYLDRWIEVPVYDLESLPVGHEVKGPAIFESPTTTV